MTETRPRKAVAESLRRIADALDPAPQPKDVAAAPAAAAKPGAPEHWLARLEEAGVSTAAYRTGAEPEGAARNEKDSVRSSGGILATGLRHLARLFAHKPGQQEAGITTAEAPVPASERTQARTAPTAAGAEQRQDYGAPVRRAGYAEPKRAGKPSAVTFPPQDAQPRPRQAAGAAPPGSPAETGARGSSLHLPTGATSPVPEAWGRSPVAPRNAAEPSPGTPAPPPGPADPAQRTDDAVPRSTADPRSTDPEGRSPGLHPPVASGRLVLNVGRGPEDRSVPGAVPRYRAAVFRSGDGTSRPTVPGNGNANGAETAGKDGANEAVAGQRPGSTGSPAGFDINGSAVPYQSSSLLAPAQQANADTGQKQDAFPASGAASPVGPNVPAVLPAAPPWPDLPGQNRLAGSAAAVQAAQGQWLDALARASRLAAEQGAR
ncbi:MULTISPECIES: hypothetical protein [Crystallibacter]|uniref:hypothetical protein n=1 Tax=Crystallibacter TaxID=3456524 RepID=UPI001473F7F0|nr:MULTISPECIES: hypothetical protein [unclassified Arthrobacter]MCW2131613.1 hypothetical protein [Arthrobacter sp. VKM Ac-2550]NMR30512.1 hypothetical protein [Arthrobacter sp. SF27]